MEPPRRRSSNVFLPWKHDERHVECTRNEHTCCIRRLPGWARVAAVHVSQPSLPRFRHPDRRRENEIGSAMLTATHQHTQLTLGRVATQINDDFTGCVSHTRRCLGFNYVAPERCVIGVVVPEYVGYYLARLQPHLVLLINKALPCSKSVAR